MTIVIVIVLGSSELENEAYPWKPCIARSGAMGFSKGLGDRRNGERGGWRADGFRVSCGDLRPRKKIYVIIGYINIQVSMLDIGFLVYRYSIHSYRYI